MGALQYVDVPGYAALLLRKTYAELNLPGALMDRAHTWLGGGGLHWDAENHTYTFPSGASITFGHLQYSKDRYRYQSAEFQYIGADELTEFEENDYRFILSRLRRPSYGALSQVPLRARAGSNPGGIGHQWVKSRFVLGHGPGRRFIPAKLADNPYLDREEYARTLGYLDPVTRERLLNGDWDAQIGGMFLRQWFKVASLPPPADEFKRIIRWWDLAATEEAEGKDPDWTVGVKMGVTKEGDFWVLDVIRGRWRPADVERMVRHAAGVDGRYVPVLMEQEPGASGKSLVDYYVRQLAGWAVRGIPSTGSKETRAAPFASQAQAGHVWLLESGWNTDYLAEFEGFGEDSKHDDQVDATSSAFSILVGGAASARSQSTLPPRRDRVVRRGDLTLRGEKYRDLPPASVRR